MTGIFNSAIFNNSVFNTDASTANSVQLLGGTPAGPNVNPNAANFYHYDTPFNVYQREQEQLAAKQEKVIALKIDAQENIVRQRELKEFKDKQSIRQLKALEREQKQLIEAIRVAMIELNQYESLTHKNMALLILIMSCPYINIGGSQMH